MRNNISINAVGMNCNTGVGSAAFFNFIDTTSHDNASPSYSLEYFQPLSYLSEKKLLKSLSQSGAIALVALENLRSDLGSRYNGISNWRRGFFVSSPSPSPLDRANYFKAMKQSEQDDGEVSLRKFGAVFTQATPPITGLLALPNAVQCFGSRLVGANGPNVTYTSGEIGGHLALMRAAANINHGRIDLAFVGGYSFATDRANTSTLAAHNLLNEHHPRIVPYSSQSQDDGTICGDGAVFMTLASGDTSPSAEQPPLANYLGGITCSMGANSDAGPEFLITALQKLLKKVDVDPEEIGLIFLNASGVQKIDQVEKAALETVFQEVETKPATAATSLVWGNLMEAGGLGEIMLSQWLYKRNAATVPGKLQVAGFFEPTIDRRKKYVLINRCSVFGDCTSIIVEPHATNDFS